MAYSDQERLHVYWVHKELKRRCSPRAKEGDRQRYHERGIRVHPRWLGRGGFQNFLDDMGSRPTPQHEIDRIDNELGYEPGNCRWVLQPVQDANRRRSPRALTPEQLDDLYASAAAGETQASIASRLGVSPFTVHRRLKASR
jgi:hypothetical protein